MGRLEQIKYVVDNSKYVSINYNNLKKYSKNLNSFEQDHWLKEYRDRFNEKEIILLVFIVESINFCFWEKPHLYKEFNGQKFSRSVALFYAILDEAINNKYFLKIDYLSKVSKGELCKILGADINYPCIDERYNNFLETVNSIRNNPGFYDELFGLKTAEQLLDYIASKINNFNDISIYKGRKIKFYKRATLLVNDLFEVSSTIRNNIQEIDDLLGCADYGIPRTLRYFGVLEYTDELSEMVDNKQLITRDSEYEIEIRANMIYALEMIKNELHKNSINVNSIRLDNIIWSSGRNIKEPHHLTKTIYY